MKLRNINKGKPYSHLDELSLARRRDHQLFLELRKLEEKLRKEIEDLRAEIDEMMKEGNDGGN